MIVIAECEIKNFSGVDYSTSTPVPGTLVTLGTEFWSAPVLGYSTGSRVWENS